MTFLLIDPMILALSAVDLGLAAVAASAIPAARAARVDAVQRCGPSDRAGGGGRRDGRD
jgi:hypothetical protein